MSSGQPLASTEASVARVAVENHPLAVEAMTTTVGSQSQLVSPPRSQRNYEQKDAMPSASVGMMNPSPPRLVRPNSATAAPHSNRSGGVSGGDANVSPSSKSLDTLADEFLLSKPPPVSLRPDQLPRGQVGIVRLRTLVDRRAWGDVFKLASTLLNDDDSGRKKSPSSSKNKQYSKVYASLLFPEEESIAVAENIDDIPHDIRQETVEILMLRCNALLKLRRYKDLSNEVEQWCFLKQNDVTAPSIEWLPWGIHILAGQSREYSGNMNQATDILCHLRDDIPSTECSWIASVDNALANIYIRRGEWRLALGSLDRIVDLIPEVVRSEVRLFLSGKGSNTSIDAESEELITSFLIKTYICEILSRQGRIFLQIGALSEAREVFGAAKTMFTKIESSISLSPIALPEEISNRNMTLRVAIQSLLEINDGLVNFSESNYDASLQSFSNAVDVLQKDGNSFHSQYRTQDWVGPSIAGCQAPSLLYNEAVNNLSLCNLYKCNMKEAVDILEALVREDPTAFLTERVAFNLCTLYELGSDSAAATRNKRVLQIIAKRFFLHDVGPESFRVT